MFARIMRCRNQAYLYNSGDWSKGKRSKVAATSGKSENEFPERFDKAIVLFFRFGLRILIGRLID